MILYHRLASGARNIDICQIYVVKPINQEWLARFNGVKKLKYRIYTTRELFFSFYFCFIGVFHRLATADSFQCWPIFLHKKGLKTFTILKPNIISLVFYC
jgi:hypothetical protein